jgi:integrase
MEEVGLSPNTVYKHHANIRKALDYALKQKFVSANVADAVELPKKIEFEGNSYTIEQLQKLLEKSKDTYLEAPIALAVYLGLRREEIAGLRWEHVNFEERTISIKEVKVRADREVIVKKPKNKSSERILHIPDGLYNILKKWKDKQEYHKNLFGKKYVESDYVCTYFDGRPIKPDKLSRRFKEFLLRNNLPPIRLHDLRHTFATVLYQNGVPVKNISEALGHSDITTTLKIYAHVIDKTNKEAVNKMDDLLKIHKET